jgi:glucan 1,3-beta-glucosidase
VPITSKYTTRNTSSAPYIPGAWPYLMRALGWARLHGLHVILDLHGAPGSQNGYDNSGKRGRPGWASSDDNVQRTLDVIRFMVTQTAGMIDIIELLNEPAGFWDGVPPVIRQYWQDGYKVVRAAAGDGLHVMIGDAFLGVNVSGFPRCLFLP